MEKAEEPEHGKTIKVEVEFKGYVTTRVPAILPDEYVKDYVKMKVLDSVNASCTRSGGNEDEPGKTMTQLYNRLTDIQFGLEEDKFEWIEIIG